MGETQDTTGDRRVHLARQLYERGELEQVRSVLLQLRAERRDDGEVAALTAWTHDRLGLESEAVAAAVSSINSRASIAAQSADIARAGCRGGLGGPRLVVIIHRRTVAPASPPPAAR